MDGQGKHVLATIVPTTIEGSDGNPRPSKEPGIVLVDWTPESVEQRVKDEARHWEKQARRVEDARRAQKRQYSPDTQLRIIRKGIKKDIDDMNAALDAIEEAGKIKAEEIRAAAPAKVAAKRAELEALLPKPKT